MLLFIFMGCYAVGLCDGKFICWQLQIDRNHFIIVIDASKISFKKKEIIIKVNHISYINYDRVATTFIQTSIYEQIGWKVMFAYDLDMACQNWAWTFKALRFSEPLLGLVKPGPTHHPSHRLYCCGWKSPQVSTCYVVSQDINSL